MELVILITKYCRLRS